MTDAADESQPPVRDIHAPAPGVEVPSHYAQCYGCGVEQESGLRVRVVAGSDLTVRGEMAVCEVHQGAPGLMHGGVLAAAFDEVLGALSWLLMRPAVTASLTVDFRAPVRVGDLLSIDARVDGIDGRKVSCSGIGRNEEGAVLATASGLFIQVPIEHFARHGRKQDVDKAAKSVRSRPWMEIGP
ncbi:MAG: PaaI family thioesterase [Candidatus Nanopelagicales bacterium]|nr:PaaI family thioesterase [Candidatus Nanopelagicales bacterium]